LFLFFYNFTERYGNFFEAVNRAGWLLFLLCRL
jgi:hypothetical protein